VIRVFHVEDYKIMRDGICHLLQSDDEIEVAGSFKNGEEMLEALHTAQADVLILDIYLDGMENLSAMNGFKIAQSLRQSHPEIKILAHSVYDDADSVSRIFNAGVMGFVSKKSGFEELILGVKTVYRGQRFFCSETTRKLKNLNSFLAGLDLQLRGKDELFTPREREVLTLLARGKSSREIAEGLFITERTVESHRKNMIEKAEVKNTVELIAFSSSVGLLKKD
jgi:DNA-binding NarL/FixJ family response regulator